MPELPEVEVIRESVAALVTGKAVERLSVYTQNLRWPIASELPEKITNQQVTSVCRRGKYLLVNFPEGVLSLHFGMTGYLKVLQENIPPGKHDHCDLTFQKGPVLRLNDVRKFGSMFWHGTGTELPPLLAELGPEPLSDDFDANYLHKKSRNRSVAIKNFIMDQTIVAGVGNIYANEALFHAKIHPATAASQLSLALMKRLVKAMKSVIVESIDVGGTMLDFRRGAETHGRYDEKMTVYRRNGCPCLVCATPISMGKINQRSIYYCHKCQR